MSKRKPVRCIRLACVECDRDDMDGITPKELEQAKANGWTDITEEQSYEQSIAEDGTSIWWTHLANCPECQPED